MNKFLKIFENVSMFPKTFLYKLNWNSEFCSPNYGDSLHIGLGFINCDLHLRHLQIVAKTSISKQCLTGFSVSQTAS